jgi:hypothetical protein
VRKNLSEEGALVVCVLSKLVETVDQHVGQTLIHQDVTEYFSGINCPVMTGRPKVFLLLESGEKCDNAGPLVVRNF